MRANEFVVEARLFKDRKVKDEVYNILIQATDAGPFDGGCVVFAQALQMLLGGEIVVLTNSKNLAQHAVTKVDDIYWDFDGPASAQGILLRFARNEHAEATGIRPIGAADLPDAPRNQAVAEKIYSLLKTQYIDENGRTYYHGTKAEFDEFDLTRGGISIDRAVGPHFSGTPELANRFALQNPGSQGRGQKYGGRVILVTIPGEVYKLPQAPGEADYLAVTKDIIRLVFSSRPDLKKLFIDDFHKQVSTAFADVNADKYVQSYLNDPTALTGLLAHYNNENITKTLAHAYRDILRQQGYGVIHYVNTGKKERKGLRGEDLDSFIALVPPRSKFSREQK